MQGTSFCVWDRDVKGALQEFGGCNYSCHFYCRDSEEIINGVIYLALVLLSFVDTYMWGGVSMA
jgi:hypothetical protein